MVLSDDDTIYLSSVVTPEEACDEILNSIAISASTDTKIDIAIVEKPVAFRGSGASITECALWTGFFACFLSTEKIDTIVVPRAKIRGFFLKGSKKNGDKQIREILCKKWGKGACRADAWQALALAQWYRDEFGSDTYLNLVKRKAISDKYSFFWGRV